MNNPAPSPSDDTIWAKVLIMLFGLAMVMLGTRPLESALGGLAGYVQQRSTLYAAERGNNWPVERSSSFARPATASYSSGFSGSRSSSAPYEVPEGVRRAIKSGEINRLPAHDEIRSDDKKELNRIINGM